MVTKIKLGETLMESNYHKDPTMCYENWFYKKTIFQLT